MSKVHDFVSSNASLATARKVATAAHVLLKKCALSPPLSIRSISSPELSLSDGGLLPLPKKGKRIAVLGFAGRSVFVGPAGSGSVVPTRLPSPLSAIARMLGHEDGTIPPRCCATRCTNVSCPAECGALIYDVMTVGGPTNLTRAAMMAAARLRS